MGDSGTGVGNDASGFSASIKVEPAFVAESGGLGGGMVALLAAIELVRWGVVCVPVIVGVEGVKVFLRTWVNGQ